MNERNISLEAQGVDRDGEEELPIEMSKSGIQRMREEAEQAFKRPECLVFDDPEAGDDCDCCA
jgi:hypothetical protein